MKNSGYRSALEWPHVVKKAVDGRGKEGLATQRRGYKDQAGAVHNKLE